jgi:hypothetical protein
MVRTRLLPVLAVSIAGLFATSAQAAPSLGGWTAAGHSAGVEWAHSSETSWTVVWAYGEFSAAPLYGGVLDGGELAAFQIGCQADTLVVRGYWNTSGSYDASPLETAQIASSGPFEGEEYSIPHCDDPDFAHEVRTDLPPSPMTMQAAFTGKGDRQPYFQTWQGMTYPDCPWAGGDVGAGRAADVALTHTDPSSSGIDFDGLAVVGAGLAAGWYGNADVYDDACYPALLSDLRGTHGRAAHRRAIRALASKLG